MSTGYAIYSSSKKCYGLVKRISRTYYKYNYSSWTQPQLTSNNSHQNEFIIIDPQLSGGIRDDSTGELTWGTASVTRFSNIYAMFSASTSDNFTLNNGNRTFTVFDIIFTSPMKLTKVNVVGNVVAGAASALTGMSIYKIEDNGKATRLGYTSSAQQCTVNVSSVVLTRLRICLRPNNDGGSYPTRCTQITITCTKGTAAVSTASDYDYFIDNNKFYGVLK